MTVAVKPYKKMGDDDLRAYVKELGLDNSGPRFTLLDRIALHFKMAQLDTADPKRKRRKKSKYKQVTNNLEEKVKIIPNVEIELVPEELDLESESNFSEFSQVLSAFNQRSVRKAPKEEEEQRKPVAMEMDSSDEDDYETRVASKKKLRKLNRVSIAVLKEKSKRPEVVDWTDTTANDPFILIDLKSYRNTVPVPPHWCQKRRFLSGKRGAEKIPFELPGKLY